MSGSHPFCFTVSPAWPLLNKHPAKRVAGWPPTLPTKPLYLMDEKRGGGELFFERWGLVCIGGTPLGDTINLKKFLLPTTHLCHEIVNVPKEKKSQRDGMLGWVVSPPPRKPPYKILLPHGGRWGLGSWALLDTGSQRDVALKIMGGEECGVPSATREALLPAPHLCHEVVDVPGKRGG